MRPGSARGGLFGAASLAAVLLLVLASGCAVQAPAAETSPTVGACYLLDRPEHFQVLSDASPAVDCARPHTSETYHLGDLTASTRLAARYPALEERGEIAAAACPPELVRDYVAADARQALYGLWTVAVIPTPSQWEAGARWVRCDLLLVVEEEGAFEPMVLELSLREAARAEEADLLLRCYAQDDAGEILDVRCSEPHDSRDVNMWMPVAQEPSELTVVQLCSFAVTEWLASGSRTAEGVSGVLRTERNGSLTLRCVAVEPHDAG